MCHHSKHTETKDFVKDTKYRLSDYFNAHWNTYCQNPTKKILPEHYKAANAIRVCRTEVLGSKVYVCSSCGDVSEINHSCKHRFCPKCSWTDTMKWAEKAYKKLLNIPHRHAVATLPHSLNPLLEQNYKSLNNLLLRSSAEAVKDWMNAKYRLMPGIISVLHTFGEKKNRHHHTHMIVSMGGINSRNELQKVADKFIPYQFIANKFRILFEQGLIKLFDSGELIHQFKNRIQLLTFLKEINQDNWRFHFEKPMESALDVIKYIGRYSKRACLSERKITNIEGEYIEFQYKDYADRDNEGQVKIKTQRLHFSEFFPLLLQHVPPVGFQVIRYYGIYTNSYKVDIKHKEKKEKLQSGSTAYKDPKYCEYCNQEKELVYVIFDKRKPTERIEKFNSDIHENIIINIKTVA